MSAPPEEPRGLGTPSGTHPGFTPPPGEPTAGPWPPPQPVWPPQQAQAPARPVMGTPPPQGLPNWSPPDPGLVVPPAPSGRPHRTPARSRVRLVAAMLAAALVLVGILSALPLLSTSAPQPQSTATPVPIITTTPSAQPGTASTASAGGDIGDTMTFSSSGAGGSVTVNSAVWTDTGEMAPEPGHRYLVLDVTVRSTKGNLPVDALMFVAQDPGGQVLPSFGPALTNPLGGQVLTAGESVRGQLGYSVVAGEVSLRLLDPSLEPLLTVRIPAP